MNYKGICDKLLTFLDSMEEEKMNGETLFVDNGVEYTKKDFNNFRKVIEKTRSLYALNVDTSQRYEYKNYEYHKTLRMIGYYKNKKHKVPKDFEKIEELQKKLDTLREQKAYNKKERMIAQYERIKREVEMGKYD